MSLPDRVPGYARRRRSDCGTCSAAGYGSLAVRKYALHPANHAIDQAHFDAVRVCSRLGENLLHGAFAQGPRPLILFLHDLHPSSRGNVSSYSSVHTESLRQLVEYPGCPTSAIRRALRRCRHTMGEGGIFWKVKYQGANHIRSSGRFAPASCYRLRGGFLLLVPLLLYHLLPMLCHLFLGFALILLAAFVSHGVSPLLRPVIFSRWAALGSRMRLVIAGVIRPAVEVRPHAG